MLRLFKVALGFGSPVLDAIGPFLALSWRAFRLRACRRLIGWVMELRYLLA
jgi:hypothetical protein